MAIPGKKQRSAISATMMRAKGAEPAMISWIELSSLMPLMTKRFMPTGGVNAKNLKDYLGCDKIIACGGSWMVKGDMIKAGQFDKILAMTKEAVELVKEIRG